MKLFSAEQIRNGDKFTIKNEGISSVNLMERAADSCTRWILKNYPESENFYIFCGNGNNGGDGFAIARMLYQKGKNVSVFISSLESKFSEDASVNLSRIKEISGISIEEFSAAKNINFHTSSVIIDALLGTGLNKPLSGKIEEIIKFLNQQNTVKISVDIPTGLYCDGIIEDGATIFKADETVSFQFWKKSFLHPEIGKFCGNVHILNIDISQKYIQQTETDFFTIDDALITRIYRPRKEFSHKGNYGKIIIAAGSFGKIGAAVLATKAALKTGSGLTFVLAPKCGYEILQNSCPEAMYQYGGEDFISVFEQENDAVYGIGPGLGTDPETEENLIEFLKNRNTPVVLDADALNILAKNEKHLDLIPENSLISPHPKEFARLFGETENSFQWLELGINKAKEFKIYIVLKDHHTQIITPEGKVFYNLTGNSGMAKGGSGDVLTGILTALLAQKYSSENAAILGVWLHGKAGDFAAKEHSEESMLPSDLINCIGKVFLMLKK